MRWSQRDKPDSAWVDALHEAFNQDPIKPLYDLWWSKKGPLRKRS